jgi:hypothetical protein
VGLVAVKPESLFVDGEPLVTLMITSATTTMITRPTASQVKRPAGRPPLAGPLVGPLAGPCGGLLGDCGPFADVVGLFDAGALATVLLVPLGLPT